MVLHLISGLFLGMVGVLFLQFFYDFSIFKPMNVIMFAVFVGLVVGILWEIYELNSGLTFLSDGMVYYRDTLSDLLLDVCGAFFGAMYAKKLSS